MRWLIVGPYPPATDPGAMATLAAMRARVQRGDEVEVVSARPSAADRTSRLAGLPGTARLRALAPGFDGLHLRLGELVGPTPSAGPALAAAERAALRAALSSFDEVVVDVGNDDLHRMPGGRAGRLVLASGARFLVDDERAVTELIARGAPVDAVQIREPVGATAFSSADLQWGRSSGPSSVGSVLPPADKHRIEAWLRESRPRSADTGAAHGGSVADALRAVPPLALPKPPPSGPKAIVGRAVARSVRWLVEPMVAHVNRLHAAAIAASEREARETDV